MLKRIGRRLTYANVMATLAFFVAVGGTTIAATKIDGGDIKRGSIKGKSLAKQTVAASKLKPDSVGGPQIREASLSPVPSAELAFGARDADLLGGMSAGELTDACPPGTQVYASGCFETTLRSALPWDDAAAQCGGLGARLPGLGELEGFRRLAGTTLANPEHTDQVFDADGNHFDNDGFVTIAMNNNGVLASGFAYGQESAAQYRCVFPLTNR